MWVILGVLAAIYLTHQLFTSILPHHFLVPPQKWQNSILKVINYEKPIYLQVSHKRSSYRRRLVLASAIPSFYTNFINNKLKIAPQDNANKDAFMQEMRRRDVDDPKRRLLYGFFHPYANNGGGGEKVLWEAVKATLDQDEKNICVVYTTNVDTEPLAILGKARDKFQVENLDHKRILFIYLRRFGKFIDGSYWKHLTIVGQLLGTFLLSLEAAFELSPDVWVDTMGLPGSYFIASVVLKIPIIAYIHYPILQENMFNKLKYNSLSDILKIRSASDLFSFAKLCYWSGLYWLYVYIGSFVDITLANGSWTFSHMQKIWTYNSPMGKQIDRLYPPCGAEYLVHDQLQSGASTRTNKLLYLAQFRPEKRHILVLKEYQQFLTNNYPNINIPTEEVPTLLFAGSCRTKDDTATLEFLQQEVKSLKLDNFVEFAVDCSYTEVVKYLSTCKFGLNAMWNEHFGIGVVEYVARGCIPIVHASAGPFLDIVTGERIEDWHNTTGFFFKSFADPDFDPRLQTTVGNKDKYLVFEMNGERMEFPTLEQLLTTLFVSDRSLISDDALEEKRRIGQQLVVDKFSNKLFEEKWKEYIEQAEALEKEYRQERRGKLERVY
ncbi:ALG11 [Candida theae]|uniref:GDP-Man:Man(3)GlcNAc(2)-PP-Dol alpha-1,2-mannosyltransferase n=1 Tax=Candida theae TaxID=1198502 RepID=A0AAD5BFL1_9ASCO|nr:ALG11 [Candida theae]KAI5959259.1 ALG11 [Candida theae]